MRPIAPPAPRRARTAAALPTDSGLGRALTTKRGDVQRGNDAAFQATYMEWQGWARRYARQIGAASFSALVVADLCARCDTRPEQRIDGEWVPINDDRSMQPIMEAYANPLQGPDELIRYHAWHYQIAGEMVQVQRDGEYGVEYGIYSTAALEWDKPAPGMVTVKLVPDGKIEKDTAFAVPRAQVIRFWLPDHEWQAYAWSPMAAVIDDLHRYRALAKYALKTADSAIAMNGLLWAPGEAFDEAPTGELGDEQSADAGTPTSPLEELYFSIAGLRHSASEDVSAVAPPLFHWAKEYGKPEWVKLGDALDPNGIAFRGEALEDFARGMPVPNTTIVGGGVGDANHWSEWLASRKMFDSAVAPTMDRVTHLDLTRSFLWPRALLSGFPSEQLGNLRIGYDPTPVIVEPDNSDLMLRSYVAGLVDPDVVLEAIGVDESARLTDAEKRAWLLDVLSHGRGATGTLPSVTTVEPGAVVDTTGATTTQAPPDGSGAPGSITAAAAPESPPFDPATAQDAAARKVVARVVRLRQQLGTKLLADARLAYDEAMKRAGVNLTNRARSRASAGRQAEVRQAVAARAPLAPLLAAVGLREEELLRHAFDTFRERALDEFTLYRDRVGALVTDAGFDVPIPTEADAASAVDYLVGALTAAVRARLLSGDEAAVVAAVPSMIPRARRKAPTGGDILPGLPDPNELSSAAARFVRNALRVNDGSATFTLGPTPDQLPTIIATDGPTIEERLTGTLDVETTFTWVHGFYGEPMTVFEPHDFLDGFTTTTPDADPDLYNSEAWPDGDLYQPGDHDGCTCEWVPDVGGVATSEEPSVPTIREHQSTADVLSAARDRVAARQSR